MIDLEKLENKQQINADIKILKNAEDYNVDLASLESLEKLELARTENERVRDEVVEVSLWQNLDVSLNDIVERVFEISLRPFIIVSDDKITYLNPKALEILEVPNLKQVIGEKLLRFVDKKDWSLLAENIGEMVTEGKSLDINLKSETNKIHPTTLHAVYLPDSNHFSFILMGSSVNEEVVLPEVALANDSKIAGLYDELTGLPNFYLFEDRLQVAVNNENYKDVRLPKNMIAVIGINIDNLDAFKKLNLHDFALKKLATTLLLSMKKTYTVARGLRYPFWILMTDVASDVALDVEIAKVKAVFNEGLTDNFTTHELVISLGVSLFPEPAHSAKKLIEQGIEAVRKSCEQSGNSLVLYSGK